MGSAAPPAYTSPPVQPVPPNPHLIEVKGDVGGTPQVMGGIRPTMGTPVPPPPPPPPPAPKMGMRAR
jgi:hypothetical protein